MTLDTLEWSPVALVSKYDDDMVNYVRRVEEIDRPDGDLLSDYCTPYETIEVAGNLLTTPGLALATGLLIGSKTNTLDSTRLRLGAGNSATAATVSDTVLGGSQYFRVLDAAYPSASGGVLTFQASFGPTEGNFAWLCWGLDIGTPTVVSSATAATLINRKVASMDTKSSGIWVLNVTLTIG